ncbi:MAG: DNA polymerase III subunit alpha, partial [Gammaproteobacteria bacterium]
VALVALFRPGPLQSGMVDTFIERKHGGDGQSIDYMHPDLEPVLTQTYGVILYQEQVMQIAQILAGYSLGQADLLRRAMGKKKPEEMAKQRAIFIEGATKNKIAKQTAEYIFDLMEKFAGYGFNKSHSAAYAVLSYQTAWLKAHYPAAFMAAVMTADMENTDKLELIKNEVKIMGLKLRPPDINRSGAVFVVESDTELRYGLGALKGLGRSAAEAICDERAQNGDYTDLATMCDRLGASKVNKRAFESLAKSGALDAMGKNRPSILATLPAALQKAEQDARAAAAGQEDMFGNDAPAIEELRLEEVPAWSFAELLSHEYESLGLYLSGHPFDQYKADAPYITTHSLSTVNKMQVPASSGAEKRYGAGSPATLAGQIVDIRKRGKRVTMILDDGQARIELALYQETFQRYRHMLENRAIRLFRGKLRFEEFIDGWRLTVSEVLDIDREIENKASRLVIHWLQKDTRLNPGKLAEILEPFRPGRCNVALYYASADGEARLKLGEDWTVRPTRALRDLLSKSIGVGSFRFMYNQDRTPD